MRGAIPPFPQYVFIALCLVKHRDNFTITFSIQQGGEQALGDYIKEIEMAEVCSTHGRDEKRIQLSLKTWREESPGHR
jgi:hypothetical protein